MIVTLHTFRMYRAGGKILSGSVEAERKALTYKVTEDRPEIGYRRSLPTHKLPGKALRLDSYSSLYVVWYGEDLEDVKTLVLRDVHELRDRMIEKLGHLNAAITNIREGLV